MFSFSDIADSTYPRSDSRYNHHHYQQQQVYSQSSKICCISLHDTDKIRLINVPPSFVSPLRFAIFEAWDRPIQQETSLKQCDGYEFKLKGRPWSCPPKNEQHVSSKKLILALLRVMEMRGWLLILASNVNYMREEKDSLFFEWVGSKGLLSSTSSSSSTEPRLLPRLSSQNEGPLQEGGDRGRSSWERELDEITIAENDEFQSELEARGEEDDDEEEGLQEGVELFAVDFAEYDAIRITEAPVAVITAIRHAILSYWKQGIQQEKIRSGSYEFKLKGYPFRSRRSNSSIETPMMLIQMLENIRLHGFKLCGSMDPNVIGSDDTEQSIESWVFRRRNSNSNSSNQGNAMPGHESQDHDVDGWVVRL
ncbi:hypothetical protein EC991_002939 [Linnemannia zychae]|nr:hypothetical protein EC991_002939 [Linnemannia zychae]